MILFLPMRTAWDRVVVVLRGNASSFLTSPQFLVSEYYARQAELITVSHSAGFIPSRITSERAVRFLAHKFACNVHYHMLNIRHINLATHSASFSSGRALDAAPNFNPSSLCQTYISADKAVRTKIRHLPRGYIALSQDNLNLTMSRQLVGHLKPVMRLHPLSVRIYLSTNSHTEPKPVLTVLRRALQMSGPAYIIS